MNDLDRFVIKIKNMCPADNSEMSIEVARDVVAELNRFLYTTYEGIGTINTLNREWDFFSEFHRYWHEHYKEILDLKISKENCTLIADALHDVYVKTTGRAFREVYPTSTLSKEEICRVRMLTANQDFRGSRNFEELAGIYLSDKTLFDENKIVDEPEEFLNCIGGTKLAQNDKRVQYAKRISQFLIEHAASPYGVVDCFNRNVNVFKEALVSFEGAGYGNKKADMFIRDMVVLGVWDNVSGFENIDVASDVNTIKVALRTGIITSAIPLVSSFLDIFGMQYEYVDEMNALAWRKVWEIWNAKYPSETILSPCLLDYFIYNVIGRQFCKENLFVFECEHGHIFKWHSGRNKTCQVCYANGNLHEKAKIIMRKLPCIDEEGSIAIKATPFYRSKISNPNLTQCPFKTICDHNNRRKLMPPKSISIMGQTGWTKAYANSESGGGGLMA